jgi:hypothetical protein
MGIKICVIGAFEECRSHLSDRAFEKQKRTKRVRD